jgi:phage terminase large subunit-like protein
MFLLRRIFARHERTTSAKLRIRRSEANHTNVTNFPHVAQATAYVRDVLAGRIPACKWVIKACERHVADLKRSRTSAWPYRFDEAKAERVCKFAELLPHVKGKWAKKDPITKKAPTIKLEPWQCFLIGSLFGWVKKSNGMRRFLRASAYIPRKNAKSTTACIIGWWMFAKDDEPGAEVYSGATSEKQAMEVFRSAWQMAKSKPDLPRQLGVTLTGKTDPGPMFRMAENAKFEALIGKPGDGASPHCAIIDEFHEHQDSTLHDTMKTGMGAREQPLTLIISTAGDNLAGPCREDWEDCEKLLDRIIEDDTHFAIIWTIDEGDDWTSEIALRKANPNWGVSVNAEMMLADQRTAARDAKKQGPFKTKHLNLWVGAISGWLNIEQWRKCGDDELAFSDFHGRECCVGLDAASKIDMTSMVANFRTKDGMAQFANHYIPEDTVALPENEHYRKWVADGWLIATPGARVDFTIVEEDLRAWSKLVNIQALAFDPKELNDFVNRVGLWASFDRVEIAQGPQFMSEPMKEFEALIADGKYRHEKDPVLTWMASNVVKKKARGGGPVKYYYPTKLKDSNKIDGIVAGIMALSRAMAGGSLGSSVYETRGVATVGGDEAVD